MSGELPARPTLRRHLAVHVTPGQGAVLSAGSDRRLVTGGPFERLLPLLTGERTADELVEALAGEFPPEEVYFALLELHRLDLLRDAGEAPSAGATAYWDAAGVPPAEAARRVAEHRFRITTLGLGPEVDGAGAFSAAGLTVDAAGDWDILLVDDYLHPALAEHNRAALSTGRPWVLSRPMGRDVWVGPLFRPGSTGCWACLAERLRLHRPIDAFFGAFGAEARPALAATAPLALAWLAGSLAHVVGTGRDSRLAGRIHRYDTVTGSWSRHRSPRRPQCPVCGDPGLYTRQADRAPVLAPRPKRMADASDQRAVSLARTYRAFRRHVGPFTGVVTGLTGRRAGRSKLVHAYSAGPNLGIRYRGLEGLRHAVSSTSAGKGTSRLKAKVSALGEALERFSGVFHGDEPRVTARLADLPGAIHPNDCMHFSERQYRTREAGNAVGWPGDRVPRPFDVSEPAEWSPVWSLASGEKRYLPTMFLYYDYPGVPGERPCIATTNGAAAGNCFEEAVLHGLLELVERDAVAIWWYNRIPRPAVDVAALADPYLDRLGAAYRAMGREWWLLDLTADLAVPVYTAVSRRTGPGPEEMLFGFGAHLEPAIAARRAVTEMNQVLVAREEPGSLFETDPWLARWLGRAAADAPSYLRPAGLVPPKPTLATPDLLTDLECCLSRLRGAGLEAFVLDHGRPDLGVPVAKVIVPELRYFRRRLAPGRLYDVPAALGWLPRVLAESDLNPDAFVL